MAKLNSVSQYIEMNKHRLLLPVLDDIVRNKRIFVHRLPDEQIELSVDRWGPNADIIMEFFHQGMPSLTDLYLGAHFIVGGPKIFCPTDEQAAALEQVRPNFPFHDYQQPFGTFAVELPENYRKAKTFDGNFPVLVILQKEEDDLLLSNIVWSHLISTARCGVVSDTSATVEQVLERSRGVRWEGSMAVEDSEEAITINVLRMAMNACSLLTMFGCQRVGYTNESHAARLARRNNPASQAELHTMPVVYGFQQDIQLYERAAPCTAGDGTHASPKPHWRIGHYRTQPHGPGLSNSKRIFIKPVLVNSHLLVGPLSNTIVNVYKR